jgi:dolichol-phosphate mannosyltransferase
MKHNRIAVVIPTYNERENIISLIEEILSLPLNIAVLVIDDDSPDGTGDVVSRAFHNNPTVHVFIRKEKRGRGLAGYFGYLRALEMHFDIIGEMDADWSHHPMFIPDLVHALENADVAVGSRYLKGAEEQRKSVMRRAISRFARLYLRFLLHIPLSDPTSGFRFFRRSALAKIADAIKSEDQFIVTEVYFLLTRTGAHFAEVPITFYERKKGQSKLGTEVLFRYLYKVLCLKFSRVRS